MTRRSRLVPEWLPSGGFTAGPLVAGLLVCATVVAFVAAAPVASGALTDLVVSDVSVSEKAVAVRDDGTVYLWQARPFTLTATVGQIGNAAEYRVCALTETTELNCTTTTLRPSTSTVELPVGESAVESVPPGGHNVSVSVSRVGANETVVVSQLVRLRVLGATGDFDGDGLENRAERRLGTDPTVADTDGDLFDDGTEVALGTNPSKRKAAVGFSVTVLFVLGVAFGLFYRHGPRLAASFRRLASGASGASRPTDEPSASGSDATTSQESEPADDDRETTPGADPSPPLSDKEQVIRLLESNDGQLPQSEIVSRTPWSKSKVSRLLARMDAQRLVVKINAGRQNVIVLPGEEPEELKSLCGEDET